MKSSRVTPLCEDCEDLRRLILQLMNDPPASHPARARRLGRLDRDHGADRRPLESIAFVVGVDLGALPPETETHARMELRAAYDAAFDLSHPCGVIIGGAKA